VPLFVSALDVARYGLWIAFALHLVQSGADGSAKKPSTLGAAAATVVAAAGITILLRAWPGGSSLDTVRTIAGVSLALPVMGLVVVEQLFRNLSEDARWSVKPLCLGLAVLFAFDLYLYSTALLFGRTDEDAVSIRGVVQILALPLLFVASRRRSEWGRGLQVSRSVAFHSATLLLVGGYLLFLSAVGYYVRYFGGTWGRALQLGLLAAGLAC